MDGVLGLGPGMENSRGNNIHTQGWATEKQESCPQPRQNEPTVLKKSPNLRSQNLTINPYTSLLPQVFYDVRAHCDFSMKGDVASRVLVCQPRNNFRPGEVCHQHLPTSLSAHPCFIFSDLFATYLQMSKSSITAYQRCTRHFSFCNSPFPPHVLFSCTKTPISPVKWTSA